MKFYCFLFALLTSGFALTSLPAQIQINHNSTTSNPQLLLRETESDFARIAFQNTNHASVRWVIAGSPSADLNTSRLNFRFEGASGAADRFTVLGSGRVGIGNTNPDEELVIGTNRGAGWAVPAITVGNGAGGAIQVGSSSYSLAFESSSALLGSKISVNSGIGLGNLRLNAGGMAIGTPANLNSDGYILRLYENNLGLALVSQDESEDLEFYSTNDGDLNLYRNGNLIGTFDGTTGAYAELSDRRLKQGIKKLENVLDQVMALRPARYTYRRAGNRKQESIGFIAQEVKDIFPEVVYQQSDERNKGMYAIHYGGFGPIAIKAIQELKFELDQKEEAIQTLQDEMEQKDQIIERLAARLDRIEGQLQEQEVTTNSLSLAPPPLDQTRAELRQNEPNPFQANTIIAYYVPEAARQVQLQIADQSGRLLQQMLVRERGQIQTSVDAAALPAGRYYYSLLVDGALIGTRKMVISR